MKKEQLEEMRLENKKINEKKKILEAKQQPYQPQRAKRIKEKIREHNF